MEFLMTYGWAILVVLAAIAALAYFGVLNPGSLMPDNAKFAGPVSSVSRPQVDLATNSFEIAFINNEGVPIQINFPEANTTPATGTECANPVLSGTTNDGTALTAADKIANGEGFRLTWTCDAPTGDVQEGSKFKLTAASFYYNNTETGMKIKHSGTVDAKYK